MISGVVYKDDPHKQLCHTSVRQGQRAKKPASYKVKQLILLYAELKRGSFRRKGRAAGDSFLTFGLLRIT